MAQRAGKVMLSNFYFFLNHMFIRVDNDKRFPSFFFFHEKTGLQTLIVITITATIAPARKTKFCNNCDSRFAIIAVWRLIKGFKDHPGAMEPHPRAVDAHPGAVEAHPWTH